MQSNAITYRFDKMAKVKRGYVLGAFFLSAIAATLNIVSLGTQKWVYSQGGFRAAPSDPLSVVYYGLFGGLFVQNSGGQFDYVLETTCEFRDNVCALLCGSSSEARLEELRKLYNDEVVNFDITCPNVPRALSVVRHFRSSSPSGRREFINAGIWLCTVIFLCISSAFGLLATGLSMWNTVSNPVESFFNIFGLYIYNAVACVSSLMVMILWGSMFATYIVRNVGILYTINDVMDSNGLASLGYSYWLNMVALLLYGSSIALLYVRQYLINKEPIVDINLDDNSDPALMLY